MRTYAYCEKAQKIVELLQRSNARANKCIKIVPDVRTSVPDALYHARHASRVLYSEACSR